jgi:hypothetical protein
MTEPRTAAGRALLADLTMGYDPEKGEETGDVVMPAVYEGMTKDILAIEAEAASSDSEALRAALERLLANAEHIFDKKPVRDWAETLAEARAALKGLP